MTISIVADYLYSALYSKQLGKGIHDVMDRFRLWVSLTLYLYKSFPSTSVFSHNDKTSHLQIQYNLFLKKKGLTLPQRVTQMFVIEYQNVLIRALST